MKKVVWADKDGNYAEPDKAAFAYIFDAEDFCVGTFPKIRFAPENRTIYKGDGKYLEKGY
jgi:hypothetical protein